MKYLRTYRLFEEAKDLTKKQTEFIDRYTDAPWEFDWRTGLVDVDGDFSIKGKKLKSLCGINFGIINGDFDCSGNKLTSLIGCPKEVRGDFDCSENELTSLEHSPKVIGDSFMCESNKLTSLIGGPEKVGRGYGCAHNQLITLEGISKIINGSFNCEGNKLKNFENGPKSLKEWVYCGNNELNTLEGFPKVNGNVNFLDNRGVSDVTLRMIYSEMKGKNIPYGAVIARIKNKIPQKDWDNLDKSAIDKLPDNQRKGYKLLGRLG